MEDQTLCPRKKKRTKKCLNGLRKNVLNKKKAEKYKENINNLHNITSSRLTLKHGIFAKGIRSETLSRNCVSKEFKARRDSDLNKLIDLANGVIIDREKNDQKTDQKTEKQKLTQEVLEDDRDILPVFNNVIQEEVRANIEKDKPSSFKENKIKSNTRTDEELDAVINDPAYRKIFKKTEIAIANKLRKYLTNKEEEEHINKLKKYLKGIYQETIKQSEDSNLTNKPVLSSSKINTEPIEGEGKKMITLNPLKYLSTINKGRTTEKKVYKNNKLKKNKIIEKDDKFCDSPEICQAVVKCKTSNEKLREDSNSCDSASSSVFCDLFDFEPPEPTFFPRRMNS